MSTSPAQQCFRDFKSECNTMKRFTVQALLSGESYTYENVVEFFEPVKEQYFECLEQIENVNEIWYGRGEQHATFVISEIVRRYTEKKEIQESSRRDIPEETESDRILGFPIISGSDCLQRGGRVRGQVLLTLDELAEYIAPIPVSVITGIVKVYGENGELKGFSICGQRNS